MSNRRESENSDSISLFPFLAVLLCTMGALLVLLVILVQRAAELSLLPDGDDGRVAEAIASAPTKTAPTLSADELAQVTKELAEVAAYQKQLDALREEGRRRLTNERERLSHAEEHARRLEEELAKLTIAAQQLKLTEQNQTVDQKQAEEELERLKKLIAETEALIENLRKEAGGKKSYAIVPYRGQNGTYRKPIYIECSAKGIVIQPEGLVLTKEDLLVPRWPGNALASVLRASREYLNQKAAQAGAPEPPDPYPLLIVRPSGSEAYNLCYYAITAWDADYGYEFIEEDMKLAFPEAVDPELARIQQHALYQSRDRLIRLVQSAPNQFPAIHHIGGVPTKLSASQTIAPYGAKGGEYAGAVPVGAGSANPKNPGVGSVDSGPQIGNLASETVNGEQVAETDKGFAKGTEAGSEGPAGNPRLTGLEKGSQGTNAAYAPSEMLDKSAQVNGEGAGASFVSTETIAEQKGANWAINRPNLKSMAIRRPIHVVVRENKMILMPASNNKRSVESHAQEISLDQSVHDISESFANAVKARIEDWGLAGSGMYWKPVLELNVEPNAQMTATRIVHLLRDSGVEVQLPQSAQNTQPNPGGIVR